MGPPPIPDWRVIEDMHVVIWMQKAGVEHNWLNGQGPGMLPSCTAWDETWPAPAVLYMLSHWEIPRASKAQIRSLNCILTILGSSWRFVSFQKWSLKDSSGYWVKSESHRGKSESRDGQWAALSVVQSRRDGGLGRGGMVRFGEVFSPSRRMLDKFKLLFSVTHLSLFWEREFSVSKSAGFLHIDLRDFLQHPMTEDVALSNASPYPLAL